jgi:hypothetical protein
MKLYLMKLLVLENQDILNYITNYGSREDISYYKEMQLREMEQKFIFDMLQMYHLRGNDYTFHIAESFKQLFYDNLYGG